MKSKIHIKRLQACKELFPNFEIERNQIKYNSGTWKVFLTHLVLRTRRKTTLEPICVVLGNEACDLDSAVSALSLSYYYQESNQHPEALKCRNFLPVLNIPKDEYPLKTEVHYLFQQLLLNEEYLTFRDELSMEFMANSQFVLVDHHASLWSKQAIAIYDHRPRDDTVELPHNCSLHLELVGSCCTLVAELMLTAGMTTVKDTEVLKLLRSAIVLDTVNFSESAKRATPKDHEICYALEEKLRVISELETRKELFDNLVKARSDVRSLTTAQLLRKDMKFISATQSNRKIALPGFPMLVEEFIKKPMAEEALKEYARTTDSSVILLIGMHVDIDQENNVQRDLGLINIKDPNLCANIKQKLETMSEPNLQLQENNDCHFMEGCFFKQVKHVPT
uniref:DHHA2 domain-containing protein n=1 Tax=Glossina brevipalpis TaxID=37001 RepID=A0A1A9X047_9MUSC